MKELGWKQNYPRRAPLPQAAWPSQLCPSAQPGNELEYVVEGREKSKPRLGCAAWTHHTHPTFLCSGNMGGWMIFGHRTGVWGRRCGTLTSPAFFSSSPPSFLPPAFLPFRCHYCLLSLLRRQQRQQELQKFWSICLLSVPLTWVQGAYVSCSALAMTRPFVHPGESSRNTCAGDERPGGIWPRVQETRRVPLAGRSSVSCPTGELCLIQVQEVLEKLSTCHWDSMMHFPVVGL